MIPDNLHAYIRQHTPDMFVLLEDLVLIQSSSYNKAGVDRVAERIAAVLAGASIACETVAQASAGNHLVARTQAALTTNQQILLL